MSRYTTAQQRLVLVSILALIGLILGAAPQFVVSAQAAKGHHQHGHRPHGHHRHSHKHRHNATTSKVKHTPKNKTVRVPGARAATPPAKVAPSTTTPAKGVQPPTSSPVSSTPPATGSTSSPVPITDPTTTSPAGGTTVTTPDTGNPSCGGEQPGGDWTCTFDDEFNGTSLDRNTWLVQTTAASGWHGGNGCAVDDPSTVSVSGGYLNLSAVDTGRTFTCHNPQGDFDTRYAEGTVTTNQGFGQAYGRWEFRAKFPDSTVAGLQSALWLWPQNDTKYGNGIYPGSGEIDVAENYSAFADLAVPYIHYLPAGFDPNVTAFNCSINRGQFNTYTLVWTKTTLTISVNDNTCLVDTWNAGGGMNPSAPFDSPFMILLTQELGIGNNSFDALNPPPLPATTQVDYVRVWKQSS